MVFILKCALWWDFHEVGLEFEVDHGVKLTNVHIYVNIQGHW